MLALEREILGADNFEKGFRNHLSTNLYTYPHELLDLLKRERFVLNVSVDLAPGARVTAGGRESDRRVRQNLERLLADGGRTGVSTVVARHTVSRLTDVGALGAANKRNATESVRHRAEPNDANFFGDGIGPRLKRSDLQAGTLSD